MGAAAGLMVPSWADAASSTMTNMQNSDYRRAQAEADAASLEARANRKEMEASETLAAGRTAMAAQQRESRLAIAAGRAAFGASGVKVNEGSPVDVMADKAAWSEYDRQSIEYQTKLASWGLKYDAAALRAEAANTRQAARTAGYNAQANALSSFTSKQSIVSLLGT